MSAVLGTLKEPGVSAGRPLEIDGPNNMAKAVDQATVIHGGHIGWPGKCVTRR